MTQETEIPSALPRVLIVDDSRIVRATIKKHLGGLFDIVEEGDGEAGWNRLLEDQTIDLVISDLGMPRLDGIGLLTRIRHSNEPRIRHMPVIIVSGEEDEETKNNAVDKGANDFITKSTDRAEMIARVNANVQLAKTARQLAATQSEQEKTATTDSKTGLATAHLLNLQGSQALAFALRHHGEVSILLLEIDRFHDVEETLGEEVADQLLGLIAKLMGSKLRKEETLARLEGARFGIVSPTASVRDAITLAERFRQTIAAAKVNYRGQTLNVTASFGISNSHHDELSDIEPLVDAATLRLQSAQQAGGNRVQSPQLDPSKTLASLGTALHILQEPGGVEQVRPHVRTLLRQLSPLLKLAREELGENWHESFSS